MIISLNVGSDICSSAVATNGPHQMQCVIFSCSFVHLSYCTLNYLYLSIWCSYITPLYDIDNILTYLSPLNLFYPWFYPTLNKPTFYVTLPYYIPPSMIPHPLQYLTLLNDRIKTNLVLFHSIRKCDQAL